MVSTPLKNISQIGSFPQVRVKIKNIWNHHLVNLFGKCLEDFVWFCATVTDKKSIFQPKQTTIATNKNSISSVACAVWMMLLIFAVSIASWKRPQHKRWRRRDSPSYPTGGKLVGHGGSVIWDSGEPWDGPYSAICLGFGRHKPSSKKTNEKNLIPLSATCYQRCTGRRLPCDVRSIVGRESHIPPAEWRRNCQDMHAWRPRACPQTNFWRDSQELGGPHLLRH